MLKLIQFHQIIQTIYQLFEQKVILVKKQQFVQKCQIKIREAFIDHLSSFLPSKIQREDQKIRLALTAMHNFHSDQEPKQILHEFL